MIAATTPAADLQAMIAGHRATIFAGGHTHIPLLRRHEQILFVNPGSVGLPGVGPGGPDLAVNEHVDWGEYAIVKAADGELTVQVVNGCLGVCDRAPICKLDADFYGDLTVERFNEVIRQAIAAGGSWRDAHQQAASGSNHER